MKQTAKTLSKMLGAFTNRFSDVPKGFTGELNQNDNN